MRVQFIAVAAAFLAASQLCQAHAHLVGSTPAEGAVLTASPQHLELNLSEPARLTAASLRRGTDKPQSLTFASSAPAAQHISLDLPALQPGPYTLQYRVISADTHIASGTVHFTVAAPSTH
jgi:methionine-rich copper-binding protein CopC